VYEGPRVLVTDAYLTTRHIAVLRSIILVFECYERHSSEVIMLRTEASVQQSSSNLSSRFRFEFNLQISCYRNSRASSLITGVRDY
jgi:hypothetical protein